jgi:hypothetical protein
LKQHVAQVVVGPHIGALGLNFHSSRLEKDNGLGPGLLLGTDLVAMDYVYGIALHEDDDRLARIENVRLESALRALVYHFNDRLHVIANVRTQIEHDLEMDYFELKPSSIGPNSIEPSGIEPVR